MSHRDLLIAWLNDAYAMEKGLIPILENHAKDAKDHPEIRSKIEGHLEKTRQHADLLRGCVERLGESTSVLKTAISRTLGQVQALTTGIFGDGLVKNGISDYATEYCEIACYKALIAAARDAGENDVVRICEQILRDEEEMARWLEGQLPKAVKETMQEALALHT